MRRPLPVFSALFAALLAAVTVLPAGAVAGTTVKTATNTAKGPTNTANKPPLARKELLDTLPMQPAEPLTAEMRRLMPENRQKPRDVDLAVRLAHVYYRQAVREGELRFVGYARSVLAPWWKAGNPPIEVRVMRANLRQYVHDFSRAADDLSAVIARQPDHAQALAIRAAIFTVRADYAAARADCERLAPLTTQLIGFACGASLDALTGKAKESYEALSDLLGKSPRSRPEERLWVLTRLAEMAERIGDHEAAERRFKQALFIDPRDQYLLGAYTDFLLDQKRPAEVLDLLHDRTAAEHLLLRVVLAEKMLDAPSFAEHEQMVGAAFATARREGHAVHQAEESRFALHVLNQPERALKLAVANWRVQRESRDARALLEAAAAANDREAAAPALQWLRDSGIEDLQLRALAQVVEQKATAAR